MDLMSLWPYAAFTGLAIMVVGAWLRARSFVPPAAKQTPKRGDAATIRMQPPVDGFAETLPSLQFSSDTTFGIH
jgi:hypothetical protein